MTNSTPTFGVYVHWPFCAQKCPYCDFNSHVRHGGWDEAHFLAAYKRELDHVAQLRADTSTAATSIFFGGGTPSLMKPETVAAILDHIAKQWGIAPGAEITLEANPNSVEAARFTGYRSAGVNRVSVGVQSLRDDDLKRLGRLHSVAEAKAAIDIATATFDRVSFDLIYSRPCQTAEAWRAELTEALALAGGHLSLYQLTIEQGTPYADLYARGKLIVPDAENAAELFEITQDMTSAAGLTAYETSNHAALGEESQHNLLYWRYGAYAGVGPGAHGRLDIGNVRHATQTERNPERWAALTEDHGHGLIERVPLSRAEEADEMLLMGLRLTEGLDLDRLKRRTGLTPSGTAIQNLIDLGLVDVVPSHTAEIDRSALDEIRACVGPAGPESGALSPAAATRLRAIGRGRFILNELVLQLSQSFVPAEMRTFPQSAS